MHRQCTLSIHSMQIHYTLSGQPMHIQYMLITHSLYTQWKVSAHSLYTQWTANAQISYSCSCISLLVWNCFLVLACVDYSSYSSYSSLLYIICYFHIWCLLFSVKIHILHNDVTGTSIRGASFDRLWAAEDWESNIQWENRGKKWGECINLL